MQIDMGLLDTLLTINSRNLKLLFIIFFLILSDAALHVWKVMISRQETFLLILVYNFVGIKCGFSKQTTGRFLLFFLKHNVNSKAN